MQQGHEGDPAAEAEAAPIRARSDSGPWSTLASLLALALIAMMLLHACMT
jgi:hypothetical protein